MGDRGPCSGAQVFGFKMRGSRAGRAGHAYGNNMGGQIEFSMRRFQMNPDGPVTRDSRSRNRKCICHLCNLLHTRQDRLTD